MIKTKIFVVPLNSSADYFNNEFPAELNEFMAENDISDDQIISVVCPHRHSCVVLYRE